MSQCGIVKDHIVMGKTMAINIRQKLGAEKYGGAI